MFWFLFALILVLVILFVATWFNISLKADNGQYSATCERFDTERRKIRDLESQHSGYGPKQQHQPALDQVVTLCLYPKAPGGEGDGHFYIPSPDAYKVGYATSSGCDDNSTPRSTEREVTLRELLNRLLKDVPVELVHEVAKDWNFVDAPPPPCSPPFVLKVSREDLYPIDNRPHPMAPGAPQDLFHALGLTPKPVVFSPHFCGLDIAL